MITSVKHAIKSMPVVGPFLVTLRHGRFTGSVDYWERRYQKGGTSGAGSYNHLAEFKAKFLNDFVAEHHVASVIELGCGDGAQLRLARYPAYVGVDVSVRAVEICRAAFENDATKTFVLPTAI
jgi:SAM-dependent methyltransferase